MLEVVRVTTEFYAPSLRIDVETELNLWVEEAEPSVGYFTPYATPDGYQVMGVYFSLEDDNGYHEKVIEGEGESTRFLASLAGEPFYDQLLRAIEEKHRESAELFGRFCKDLFKIVSRRRTF